MTFLVSVPKPHPRGWYDVDGVRYPRVSRIIGLIAKPGIGAWREKLIREGRDPDAEAKAAADRGTAVHQITEAIDRGQLAQCADDLLPFVRAYMDWKADHVASVEMVERIVYHARYGYAGTLDRVYVLRDGRRVLGDLKTGRSVDAIYRLQQIAYVEALEEMGEGPIDGRLIVHLPWDRLGTLAAFEYDNEAADRRAWRRVLGAWKWRQQVKNEWKATR